MLTKIGYKDIEQGVFIFGLTLQLQDKIIVTNFSNLSRKQKVPKHYLVLLLAGELSIRNVTR
jgi:hypothetical protein